MSRPLPRRAAFAVLLATALVLGLSAPALAGSLPGRTRWLADTVTAMHGSQAYLKQRVADRKPGERLAINLDIDNTSIQSHYAYPKPVPVTLRFVKYARKHDVTLFFNTGRSNRQLAGISNVLTRAGFDYQEICGKRSGESLSQSKQRCRAHFVDEGYTIIANVGNRGTDFTGGDYEKAFRLPAYGGKLS